MPFCTRCQKLSIEHLVNTEILFQPDLPTLKRNAENGCSFCTLCWTALRQSNPEDLIARLLQGKSAWVAGEKWTPTIWLIGLSLMDRSGSGQASIEVSVGKPVLSAGFDGEREEDQNPQPNVNGTLALYETPGQLSRYKLFGRRSTVDQNPDLYLALIRHWLNDCLNNHETCKSPVGKSSGVMPTRVIDVGDTNIAKPPSQARLVYTKGLRERYIALSYCWGPDTSDIFTLDAGTYAVMTSAQGFPVSKLARTHREIIALARALGIRYVWVDALCIIQGDAADWEKESKMMARVYGDSTLTVVAGRSPSSKSGFVTNDINLKGERPPPCQLPVSRESPTSSDTVTVDLRRSREIGPLLERGWCFQERLSAPRAVLFAEEQTAFLCNREQYWEDGWVSRNPWRPKFVQQQPKWITDPKLPLTPAEETLKDWYWMLFHYSQCLLSNPHDIFAAICAVAQQASRTLVGSRYLAGIWEADMVRGLLWRPCYHFQLGPAARTPTTRPKPTRLTKGKGPVIRAPSWSWAAVEGPVAGPSFNPSQVAKYRDPKYPMVRPGGPGGKWSLNDTYGVDTLHMPECELRLLGRAGYALTSKESVKDYLKSKRGRSKVVSARVASHGVLLLEETARAPGSKSASVPWQDSVVGVGFFDDESEKPSVSGVWCLPIVQDLGLILKKNANGKFSRLGWCSVEEESWFQGKPEANISLC